MPSLIKEVAHKNSLNSRLFTTDWPLSKYFFFRSAHRNIFSTPIQPNPILLLAYPYYLCNNKANLVLMVLDINFYV